VNTLLVGIREHRLSLAAPSDVRIEPGRIVVDTARLVGQEGEEVLLGGDFPETGAVRAFARVDSLHLADIGDLTQFRVPLAGTLVASADVAGTRSAPEIALDGSVAGAQVGEFSIARITFSGRYANERAVAQLQLLHQDSVVADLRASLPVDYETLKLVQNDTLRVTLRSRDVDLRLVESFTPKVRRAGGRFTANVDAAGRVGSPQLSGSVSIVGGAATLPDAGIRLDQVTADIVTNGDTVHIRRLSAHSGDEPNDLLLITGRVTDALTNNPSFNIEIDAREFNMVDTRRLATLWISTPQPLRLTGSWERSLLQGTVLVDRGVIYMPEQSDKQLITLQLADLAGAGLDTSVARRLRLMPTAPSSLVSGLTVQGVRVAMGPNVRIQSAESREMNIQLGGALEVDVARGSDGNPPQLVLNGELLTERGTYLLNIGGVVQRTFTIESGTLRFFDDADFNPLLDIRAVYAVPQVRAVYGGRNDVRIGVRIGGTLGQPSLSLYSADSLRLSQSDLISYLVLGRPSFEIGGTPQQNASQLSAILLSTAGNYLSSRLSGGFFDYVQLQTAADRLQISQFNIRQAGSVAGSVLSGTQLGIGKQINDRTIISLNTGVCVLGQADDPATLWRSIGAKIEYQIKPDLGVGGSLDPPLSSLLCGLQTQGFSTSLRQVGFDLFRNFRW
jgi:translocation and assembly module TamB